jgi:putative oxidoreductase
MSKGLKTALWVLSILLGAMFVFSGGMKLLKPDEVKPMFVHYGYAAWFATFIGVCEALGGLGLVLPRLGALAAAGLTIIMAGAVYTHWTHREFTHGLIPLVIMLLLIVVAWMRVKEAKGSPTR